MTVVIAGGKAALERIAEHLAGAACAYALSDVWLLLPIERPGKYLAIGMKCAKHVAGPTSSSRAHRS